MKLSDFNFLLPPSLIAQYPMEQRTASRLMRLNGPLGALTHHRFDEVLHFLEAGDVLVLNNTKVIPARLMGKKATGGQVEVLVERILDNHRMLAQVRVSKPPQPGDFLHFTETVSLEVLGRQHEFYELRYQGNKTILEVVEEIGHIPLPPYMERQPDDSDKERYQTVFAENKGSVAAPTAGLHFDQQLLDQLKHKKVEIAYITLHVGAGTFKPVRVDNIKEHKMHAEYFEVSETVCEKVQTAKAHGRKVVAVGTTSLRALESASQSGEITPYCGETNIFIYPGYEFRCVDTLITNFHLPCSTLLMLVCAFGGYSNVMQAYRTAVEAKYRFFSYGDAMLVMR